VVGNGNVLAELECATVDPKSAREVYMAKYPKYELCRSANEGCYILLLNDLDHMTRNNKLHHQ
jgi:hypothetical protein